MSASRRGSRLFAASVLLALGGPLLAGCWGEAAHVPAAATSAYAEGAPAHPTPPADTLFHPTEWGPSHRMALPGWDVGTGILRIRRYPRVRPDRAPADTSLILAEPRADAPPVGRFHHAGYLLRVEATEPGLRNGTLEVGYEEGALPVLEVTPDGGWARVAFALDGDDVPRTGWVHTRDDGLELAFWDEWLARGEVRGALFVIHPDRIAFFEEPGGEPRRIALVPGGGTWGYDYILYPLRVEGPWMEVRVVSPSDYCSDPGSPLDETAWIRYLDADGRPLVWYYTRGC